MCFYYLVGSKEYVHALHVTSLITNYQTNTTLTLQPKVWLFWHMHKANGQLRGQVQCNTWQWLYLEGLFLSQCKKNSHSWMLPCMTPEYMDHWVAGLCSEYHTCRHKKTGLILELWQALTLSITTSKFWFCKKSHEDFLYRWQEMAGILITCKLNPSAGLFNSG